MKPGVTEQIAPVEVWDQLQKREQVFSSYNELFYFISNGGHITLSTKTAKVHFGFVVNWYQYNFEPTKNVTVCQPDAHPQLLKNDKDVKYLVTAYTRASVTITPPSNTTGLQYLRGVFVFDGVDGNLTYLGTGRQLLDLNTQFVSSTKYLTVLCFGDTTFYPRGRIVVQDYENTKNIASFQSISCQIMEDCDKISLNGTNEVSALQIFSGYQKNPYILTGLNSSGRIDIYNGGFTKHKANVLGTYLAGIGASSFPQQLFGELTTFVMSTPGFAQFSFTRKNSTFQSSSFLGRRGFISANAYGVSTTQQSINTYINAPNNTQSANFKVTVVSADLVENSTLKMWGMKDGKSIYSLIFSSSNLPTLNLVSEIYGDAVHIEFSTHDSYSEGCLLNFAITKAATGSFTILIFTLITLSFLLK